MTDPKKIKTGDVMAVITYFKVKTVAGETVIASDLYGGTGDFKVEGAKLLEKSLSADQFSKEEKVTKTDAAQKLVDSVNVPLTVCFDKADGTERILRGKLVNHEALLGRSLVEDFDLQPGPNRLRQVDHRTIKWLIVGDIKYTVK